MINYMCESRIVVNNMAWVSWALQVLNSLLVILSCGCKLNVIDSFNRVFFLMRSINNGFSWILCPLETLALRNIECLRIRLDLCSKFRLWLSKNTISRCSFIGSLRKILKIISRLMYCHLARIRWIFVLILPGTNWCIILWRTRRIKCSIEANLLWISVVVGLFGRLWRKSRSLAHRRNLSNDSWSHGSYITITAIIVKNIAIFLRQWRYCSRCNNWKWIIPLSSLFISLSYWSS